VKFVRLARAKVVNINALTPKKLNLPVRPRLSDRIIGHKEFGLVIDPAASCSGSGMNRRPPLFQSRACSSCDATQGRVVTKLRWESLGAEDFERLLFSLISAGPGYENPGCISTLQIEGATFFAVRWPANGRSVLPEGCRRPVSDSTNRWFYPIHSASAAACPPDISGNSDAPNFAEMIIRSRMRRHSLCDIRSRDL